MIQTDRELIKRVLLLNDRSAYGDLVRKYQAAIRAYLYRLTHSREFAMISPKKLFCMDTGISINSKTMTNIALGFIRSRKLSSYSGFVRIKLLRAAKVMMRLILQMCLPARKFAPY